MIKFTKMEGLGNDYVYLDCTKMQEIKDVGNLAQIISNRHFGVGSDGLILICKSEIADFKMRMFNSDGSEAEMCGNGIRCVGKFVYDKKLTQKTEVTIETLAGIKKLKLNIENEEVKTVRVDMGEPILKAEQIPIQLEEKRIKEEFVKTCIDVLGTKFEFTAVSMGNPHAITFVKDVNSLDVEKYGKIVEIDLHFPKKTNVEFIEVINHKELKMRVWERGSGETLACGTGACASVVATILNKKATKDTEITIELLGGKLEILWSSKDNHVYMTGPAKTVFEGIIQI